VFRRLYSMRKEENPCGRLYRRVCFTSWSGTASSASPVPSPLPLRHGAIYKTLISCDEELMDRRASPRTVDVIYWSMYNEVTSCNSPLQPLSGLRESASAKRDEDKLRTHPFRVASLALTLAGALLLFFQTRDRWSHQVMHPI